MSITTAGGGCIGATVCDARSGNVVHVDVAICVVFWLVLGFHLSAGSIWGVAWVWWPVLRIGEGRVDSSHTDGAMIVPLRSWTTLTMTAELTVLVETLVAGWLSLLLLRPCLLSVTAGVNRVRVQWGGSSINSSYTLLVEFQTIEKVETYDKRSFNRDRLRVPEVL